MSLLYILVCNHLLYIRKENNEILIIQRDDITIYLFAYLLSFLNFLLLKEKKNYDIYLDLLFAREI